MVRASTKGSRGFAAAGALAFVIAGCGGGSTSSGGTSPSPTPPSDGTSTATITIANNAVNPQNITVPRGSRVTFVNNDNQPHDMESDPHPVHTDCPEINEVGFIAPGQRKQTGILSIARMCGYHDHNRDMVQSLQGTISSDVQDGRNSYRTAACWCPTMAGKGCGGSLIAEQVRVKSRRSARPLLRVGGPLLCAGST